MKQIIRDESRSKVTMNVIKYKWMNLSYIKVTPFGYRDMVVTSVTYLLGLTHIHLTLLAVVEAQFE